LQCGSIQPTLVNGGHQHRRGWEQIAPIALSEADSRSPYCHHQVQWSVFEQRENILHKRALIFGLGKTGGLDGHFVKIDLPLQLLPEVGSKEVRKIVVGSKFRTEGMYE
jgi:hypothetical protein